MDRIAILIVIPAILGACPRVYAQEVVVPVENTVGNFNETPKEDANPQQSQEGELDTETALEYSKEDTGFEEPRFKVNGYIQSQVGVFVAPDKTVMTNSGPTNHGDKLGQLSMFRNTLQLEADWLPVDWIGLHAIFRGVRSLRIRADKDAQPPDPKKYDVYTGRWVEKSEDEIIGFVHDKYYTETDIRELYLDIQPIDWLFFRVGRQQVSWGETGQYRLLDVVNPLDSTWHFGALESFEDQRIPLWMLKTQIDVSPLEGALEMIWIPMLDPPERTVTIPLTFVGAWGLPPPKQVLLGKYHRKVFMYPENDVENSRLGVRWKGEIGPYLTYTLAYMYTHILSPPIPYYMLAPTDGRGFEVYLGFPRAHVAGLSMETALPHPITLNIKFEAAFEPDRTYPVSSLKAPKALIDVKDKDGTLTAVRMDFDNPKKKVLSYALTFQRPTAIRWLNPEQTTMFVLQFMHTWITDFKSSDMIVEIPGYDTVKAHEHVFRFIGAVFTSYLHGKLNPKIVGAYIMAKDVGGDVIDQGGFVSAQLGFVFGNHFRATLAVNQFFGSDPYDGVGLFRDRDEVNLLVRYQF